MSGWGMLSLLSLHLWLLGWSDVLGCTRATLTEPASFSPWPEGLGNLVKLCHAGDRALQLLLFNEEYLVSLAGYAKIVDNIRWIEVRQQNVLRPKTINNMQPEIHQALYRVIEEILSGFIPMFDRVLGDSNNENPLACDGQRLEAEQCIWGDEGPEGEGEEPPDEDEFYDFIRDEWKQSKKILPEAVVYEGQLEQTLSKNSLRGMTIQCIIKLANIHLIPDRPEYEGGSWHVEGMANEHIVASGIYAGIWVELRYLLTCSHSTTTKRTSQKPGSRSALPHGNLNSMSTATHDNERYRKGWCVQQLGEMVTKEGRALSWPNQYQHRVSPFKLSDLAKPGHRKIPAIFLVDPTIKHIPSTTVVPPQQAEWASEALQEVVDLVKAQLPTTFMTLKEAEQYRLALMEERTVFVEKYDDTACGVQMNIPTQTYTQFAKDCVGPGKLSLGVTQAPRHT
ncbi:hypothetical protein B0H19DRAFT_1237361 [Mycena capillaripes]|nr:hypothetical protein B0H19DRAFT_1237361 [Mycena capillaripes]